MEPEAFDTCPFARVHGPRTPVYKGLAQPLHGLSQLAFAKILYLLLCWVFAGAALLSACQDPKEDRGPDPGASGKVLPLNPQGVLIRQYAWEDVSSWRVLSTQGKKDTVDGHFPALRFSLEVEIELTYPWRLDHIPNENWHALELRQMEVIPLFNQAFNSGCFHWPVARPLFSFLSIVERVAKTTFEQHARCRCQANRFFGHPTGTILREKDTRIDFEVIAQ
jgi:hypothetical protein